MKCEYNKKKYEFDEIITVWNVPTMKVKCLLIS